MPIHPAVRPRSRTAVLRAAWFVGACLAPLGGCSHATEAKPADTFNQIAGVALGGTHSCLVRHSGETSCWGSNTYGELGIGADDDRSVPALIPGLPFSSLAAGVSHTCGLTSIGTIYCWGRNANGELGDGTTTRRSLPVIALSDRRFSAVAVGTAYSCALAVEGDVYCWGYAPPIPNGETPVLLNGGGLTFTKLAGGATHACAIATTGLAYCWGRNESGQLGGTTIVGEIVVTVSGGRSYTSITAGGNFTCALTANGNAWCWGSNAFGQLGDGTQTSRATPTLVSDTLRFATISAGTNHTCGTTTSGATLCWGSNEWGQLGYITSGATSLKPAAVGGSVQFSTAYAGGAHSCGIATGSSNALYCWGKNSVGQVGDGSKSDQPFPVLVSLSSAQ